MVDEEVHVAVIGSCEISELERSALRCSPHAMIQSCFYKGLLMGSSTKPAV